MREEDETDNYIIRRREAVTNEMVWHLKRMDDDGLAKAEYVGDIYVLSLISCHAWKL